MKQFLLPIFFGCMTYAAAQAPFIFPIDDLNALIQNGTCQVTHSPLDIGSIQDVFDGNDATLARSANVNPLVITLKFPFAVTFSTSKILQTYSGGWWTLEAADTESDLQAQSGSYVLLFSMSPLADGVPELKSFAQQSKKIIRLTVRRGTGDNYVHLNEWGLVDASAFVLLTSLCAQPDQLWLLPGSTLDVSLYGVDSLGLRYPIGQSAEWNVDEPSLASIFTFGGNVVVTSTGDTGSTTLTVFWNGLNQAIPVHVVEDFKPKTAPTRTVKVALVVINPPIAAAGGQRFHQRFGWDDPVALTNALRDSLNAASGGAVDYQIIQTYDESILYADFQGTTISVDSMYRLFLEPGWTTFHQLEQIGGAIQFDYNALLVAHDFCSASNAGQLDEVWVYSMPFTGMYESRLTGDGAFWYNSPPLTGNSCTDQLPIMGFNYERGVAEAMHSFGHRVESAMTHTFGRWDYNAADKNDWEKFVSYDLVAPEEAHNGNIHFPPNAKSDYDYGNQSFVNTFADNWTRYPFLFEEQRTVNCAEWECSQLGFMSWWFRHLPHFACKNKNGILNNWWAYIVDYNEGKSLATNTPACGCEIVASPVSAVGDIQEVSFTIYPNPASGTAILNFGQMPGEGWRVDIFNLTGMSARSVSLENSPSAQVDLRGLAPGSYWIVLRDRAGKFLGRKLLVMQL